MNAASNIEQILAVILPKAAAIWQPTTHQEKLLKLDETDIRETAVEIGTSS